MNLSGAVPASAAAEAVVPRVGAVRRTRLRSLDALRGIAIAAMILVNNPGSDDDVYAPLRHAEWNGVTLADFIFPFFLFVVGVAVTFSLQRSPRGFHLLPRSTLRRTLLLFGLGIFLNGFPLFDWSVLRVPGVLQRIAICYLLASIAAVALRPRGLALLWGSLVLGYWALLALIPWPGGSAPGFGPENNWVAYVDVALLRGHLLHESWDPEGILSTLPALATTLTGVLAGSWLRSARTDARRVGGLLAAGAVGVGLGLLLDAWCPLNKNLWTSSFVLLTGGAALGGLGLLYWSIDVKGWQGWALPFVVYGANPIVVYVLSSLIAKELLLWRVVQPGGAAIDLQRRVFQTAFLPWTSPAGASLSYAAAYVLLWFAVAAFLYERRVYIRI